MLAIVSTPDLASTCLARKRRRDRGVGEAHVTWVAPARSPTRPSQGENLSLVYAGISQFAAKTHREGSRSAAPAPSKHVESRSIQPQELERSPVHVPQLVHVWRLEQEAFPVEMPLTRRFSC